MSEEQMDELLDELREMKAKVDDTLERLMGDEELYLEYLLPFPDNENITKLQQAVANRNAKDAEDEVHTLKGMADNLGLLPLVDVCMDMLLDFREDNPESGFARMDEVQSAFDKWSAVIKKYQ